MHLHEFAAKQRKAKGSTRGNVRTEVDGIKFASKAEARRYDQLKILEKSGKVIEFRHQVRLPLKVHGVVVCTYIPDFQVWYDEGASEFEDVKGFMEYDANIKIKLARALGYNIRLLTKKTNPELWRSK